MDLIKMNDWEKDIQRMFAKLSPRYDLLNRLLSFRRDKVWRKRAAKAIQAKPEEKILDVAAGTGDMLLALQDSGAALYAADFCEDMLRIGRQKAPLSLFVVADAYKLPFCSGFFDKLTIAFGFRNIARKPECLKEFARVLTPNGGLFILELSKPKSPIFSRIYWLYFEKIAPLIGKVISGQGEAYQYLPDSVRKFPEDSAYLDIVSHAGFKNVKLTHYDFGICTLLSAVKS